MASANVQCWSVQEVCHSLKQADVSFAMAIFQAHGVDGAKLLTLTEESLRDGLAMPDPNKRRKIMHHIASCQDNLSNNTALLVNSAVAPMTAQHIPTNSATSELACVDVAPHFPKQNGPTLDDKDSQVIDLCEMASDEEDTTESKTKFKEQRLAMHMVVCWQCSVPFNRDNLIIFKDDHGTEYVCRICFLCRKLSHTCAKIVKPQSREVVEAGLTELIRMAVAQQNLAATSSGSSFLDMPQADLV